MLTFSDSAKYAEAAKNLLTGNGFKVGHSFFNQDIMTNYFFGQQFTADFLPGTSTILLVIFKFFGVSDDSILLAGVLFYILCCLLVFLIAKTINNKKSGLLALVLFTSSLFFHDYLFNFSSEIPLTLEILLITYVYIKVKRPIIKWTLVALIFSVTCITRQQVSLVYLAFSLAVAASHYITPFANRKKIILVTITLLSLGILGLTMSRDSSISPTQLIRSTNISSQSSPGVVLRGGSTTLNKKETIISKTFYNVYNFAKATERLAVNSVFLLFIVFIFVKTKSRITSFFKFFSGTIFVLFVFAASATLPNARYVHPVMPLVYIGAGIALCELSNFISQKKILSTAFIAVSILLITLPTIGHYTLDARSTSRIINLDKPAVYRQISKVMAENIPRGHLIITNLDAWAAWYDGLTTMWFPLKPEMLNVQKKPEYIVITNYLEGDRDFSLGDWKEVVYSPEKITNKFLNDNYKVIKIFVIMPNENRERVEIKGTILKLL